MSVTVSAPAVITEIITDWPRLAALGSRWNDLLEASRADSVFLTWEWIRAWSEVVGPTTRPLVVTAWDPQGELIGLAPFYVSEVQLARTLRFRTLRVMGDQATGSEYPDWIAHRLWEAAVTRAIASALAQAGRAWDCIWMPRMAGWTGAVARIAAACRDAGFHHHVRSRQFSSFELPADPGSYVRSLSQNKRQQLRSEMRRIMGHESVAVTRCQSPGELPRYLDALFALHHQRWQERGEAGVFRRRPSEARFYREFTRVALDRGWLWLTGLEDRGELKAVQLGYVYGGVYHQLQEGFDPRYASGVGNVLRVKSIEACIASGVRGYDFLGGMTEHKRRWLATPRTGYDLFIGRRSLKNRLLFAREIWPTGRFLRPRGQPGGGGGGDGAEG
jgi:CelD/BcsL family acetyltransferase involved in cellulose biosynthesis